MSATRAVIRDGVPVFAKTCDGCGMEGVAGDGRESDFYVNSRHSDGRIRSWRRLCRACDARRVREQHADPERRARRNEVKRARHAKRMAEDVEYAEMMRRRARERARLLRADPVKAARLRARHREYMLRVKQERPVELLGQARENYALRADRDGRTLRMASTKRLPPSCPREDAEPFRRYLLAYQLATGLREAEETAQSLGIESARVRGVLAGQPNVALDVIDKALLNATVPVVLDGREILFLDDLYPLAA